VSVQTVGGRYAVEKTLGGGGMAVVYLAHDAELGRPVAVKVLADNLADDPELRARFVREARLAARLSHPNVVRVYDAGEEDGLPFIVMECVDGESLAETVRREGRLDPDRVVELGLQACAGLEHAHRAGLVHRDVKPANLLVSRGTLKIADFGIAHAVEGTRLTAAGTVLGTAAYLSPEQALGEPVTAASDLYSLGACLYELLAGHPPYGYQSLAEVYARSRSGPPPRLDGVPAPLERAVLGCLARDPADRPATAAALARELAPARPSDPATAATRVARPHKAGLWRNRLAWAAAIAAGGLVGLVGAVTVVDTGGGEQRAPQVEPVPRGDTPAQDFRNLADWLRERGER
jgi:eukaryotic-like serine/threonine-protein kinase